MSYTIMIIDDEQMILDMLRDQFEMEQYQVITAKSGEEALQKLTQQPDIILLDINMPGMDGLELCRSIRDHVVCPILFVTARVTEQDKINGLQHGGDDYITKPFSTKELIARIQKVLLRQKKNTIITVQNIEFDLDKMVVYKNKQEIILTSLELKILHLLFLNLNKVVTRNDIIDKIWEWTGNDVNDNTITVYLKRIREKLDTDIIKTIKGIGYRIDTN